MACVLPLVHASKDDRGARPVEALLNVVAAFQLSTSEIGHLSLKGLIAAWRRFAVTWHPDRQRCYAATAGVAVVNTEMDRIRDEDAWTAYYGRVCSNIGRGAHKRELAVAKWRWVIWRERVLRDAETLRREGEENLDNFHLTEQLKMHEDMAKKAERDREREVERKRAAFHAQKPEWKAKQKELRAAAKALGGKTLNPAKLEILKSLHPADLLRQHQHARHMANLKHKERKRRSKAFKRATECQPSGTNSV
ncbi:hypothetical protein V8E36_006558 [Tilletia maclaganii]